MKNKKIVAGIGELLWDMLPDGKQLGGAPCNFAFHAAQAGYESIAVSAVGNDKSGEEIRDVVKSLGLQDKFIQTNNHPTGTVTVVLDKNGHPDYTIHENVAWDNINWSENMELLAAKVDAVCFGSLAQRNSVSMNSILKFLECTKTKCLRVFDINLRQQFYKLDILIKSLEFANVLKLNDDELAVVAGLFELEGDEESLLNQLLAKFEFKLIAYTKGNKGSLLLTNNEKSYCEAPIIDVVDTVGAGDSFTAVLLAGMLNKVDLIKTHKAATDIAAYVCTQHGAIPKLPEHLLNQINI